MAVSRKRKPTMQTCPLCKGKRGTRIWCGTIDNPTATRWHRCPDCKGTGKTKIKAA